MWDSPPGLSLCYELHLPHWQSVGTTGQEACPTIRLMARKESSVKTNAVMMY